MTKRVIRAISNPRMTSGGIRRTLLLNASYAIDIPALLEAARETGTWIDQCRSETARSRLALWPLAKKRRALCDNPDAHRTARLQDLWFGIGAARKGWLTKEDVVNVCRLPRSRRN